MVAVGGNKDGSIEKKHILYECFTCGDIDSAAESCQQCLMVERLKKKLPGRYQLSVKVEASRTTVTVGTLTQ